MSTFLSSLTLMCFVSPLILEKLRDQSDISPRNCAITPRSTSGGQETGSAPSGAAELVCHT